MTKRKSGVVLNMASVHETIPWEGYSAYTASKAGMGMMTKTLAMEAAPFGVRVLALAPGAIQTPINETVWEDASKRADLLSKAECLSIPALSTAGRWGDGPALVSTPRPSSDSPGTASSRYKP